MQQKIGKYLVQKPLGHGAFGDVFAALHPYLQKSVAIKKLKAAPGSDGTDGPDTRLTFASEARETSKLAHPNIVTVHDFDIDEADGGPYLVMELLDGETIEKKLSSRPGQMTLFEKIEIMQQVAEGLQFAHSRNVIHRDIKPANIMVLSDGTAKVMDFSVAPEGFMTGTPAYMSPEQLRGTADTLTDVFGYGAVYYELLTEKKAFSDPNKDPEHASTSHYEPPRVGRVIPDCPPWLDDIVSRLIEKRRDRRIGNLEEMLVVTRPILLKLKRERAEELASGIEPLVKAGKRDAAVLLVERILRLDSLNLRAREARENLQSGQRGQARVRAQALVAEGQTKMNAHDFDQAAQLFEQAATMDIGSQAIEKLLGDARRKAEERRTANRLVDEVLEAITTKWSDNPGAPAVQTAFDKVRRAMELDEYNRDAATLRDELKPAYEEVCDRQMKVAHVSASASGAQFDELYERRLRDAAKARRNREFDDAMEILLKLRANAPDDRVMLEIAIVEGDRAAYLAAAQALRQAENLRAMGDLDGAKRVLDAFAEENPRQATWVREQRLAIERELEAANAGTNVR